MRQAAHVFNSLKDWTYFFVLVDFFQNQFKIYKFITTNTFKYLVAPSTAVWCYYIKRSEKTQKHLPQK